MKHFLQNLHLSISNRKMYYKETYIFKDFCKKCFFTQQKCSIIARSHKMFAVSFMLYKVETPEPCSGRPAQNGTLQEAVGNLFQLIKYLERTQVYNQMYALEEKSIFRTLPFMWECSAKNGM